MRAGGGNFGGRGRVGLGWGEVLACGGVSGEGGGLDWSWGYFSRGICLWAFAKMVVAETIRFCVRSGGIELHGGGSTRRHSGGRTHRKTDADGCAVWVGFGLERVGKGARFRKRPL